ncbi:MAG: rRNA adenine N-6-methyltransferase family protein, partial [Candidatus Nanohaloarchaea archaeon]
VIEIGAGLGTITAALAVEADRVVAYENDPDLLPALEAETADLDNVEVREEDVLRADLPGFDVAVGNIPFHLSTDIVEMLGTHSNPVVLLVQAEFADRLVAGPGEDAYSRVTVETGYHFLPSRIREVPQRAFYPEADVSGAVVELFPRNEDWPVDERFFDDVVRALFVHRMKKARNAFVDSRHMLDIERDVAKTMRDDLPHAQARVRDLSIRDLMDIAAFLHDRR